MSGASFASLESGAPALTATVSLVVGVLGDVDLVSHGIKGVDASLMSSLTCVSVNDITRVTHK